MSNQASQHNSLNNFDEVIDLRHYWRVLMRNRWNIIGFSGVVTLLVILIVWSMAPTYRATTTLLIEANQAKVVSIEEVYGLNTQADEYFLTQFEILKSRQLAERTVRRLDLINNPYFNPQDSTGFSFRSLIPGGEAEVKPSEDQVIMELTNKFMSQLSISPVQKTQLVKVSFDSISPELSAAAANAMAEVYIESYLEAKLEVTRKAADWLGGRLEHLRDKLDVSELALQNYRERENLLDIKGVHSLASTELEELTTQLIKARQRRSELENLHRKASSLRDRSAEELLSIPEVLAHPLIRGLKEDEAKANRQVSELAKRYGRLHPKMQSAQAEKARAIEAIKNQVLSIITSIGRDYEVALDNEASLQKQVDILKNDVQLISRKNFKLRELEREANTNRQLYGMFMTRIKETDETGGMQAAHARVIDSAIVPSDPIKPKKKLIVILAAFVSGMFAVVLAFILDLLDNTLRQPEDVEERLNESLLGIVPLDKSRPTGKAFEAFVSDNRSQFAEAIRSIRTGFVLSNLDTPAKVTVVTSSTPNEGKSTIALNLGEALAQMEKVLLIDADMRRPTLAKTCGLDRSAKGLSNLVSGTSEAKDCIHRWDIGSMDIMPAGLVPPNPLELLSSKRFAQVIEGLRKHYDRIIIDSAPTQAVSDALVLSSLADAVVYVARADSTSVSLVKGCLKRLKDINAPITGVVLNGMDMDKKGAYSDEYAHYYGGYYGSDSYDDNVSAKV